MTIRSPRSLAAFAVTTTVALAMGISACSQTNNQGASEQLASAKATLQSAAAEASTASPQRRQPLLLPLTTQRKRHRASPEALRLS